LLLFRTENWRRRSACVSGANGAHKRIYAAASHSTKASATSIVSRAEAPVL